MNSTGSSGSLVKSVAFFDKVKRGIFAFYFACFFFCSCFKLKIPHGPSVFFRFSYYDGGFVVLLINMFSAIWHRFCDMCLISVVTLWFVIPATCPISIWNSFLRPWQNVMLMYILENNSWLFVVFKVDRKYRRHLQHVFV